MARPNFLIIGASRCGTTWLHDMLARHPQTYMSEKRKEVNFFNGNFDKGWGWYESFFPIDPQGYVAIGESTPIYLYDEPAARRIADTAEIRKLITILRNPLDRLISVYFLALRYEGYNQPLSQFIDEMPVRHKHCLYSEYIEKYWMDRPDQPLTILITEESTSDVIQTQAILGEILSIDPSLFPAEAGAERINGKSVPKLRKPYDLARKIAKVLRDQDLDHVVNLAHKAGARKLFGFREPRFPILPPNDYLRQLAESFLPEVERIETLIGRNLDIWRARLVGVIDNPDKQAMKFG